MAGFYKKVKKSVGRILGKYGVKVTIRRIEKSQYNPATGYTDDINTEWQAFAIKTQIEDSFLGIDGGTRIEVGDMSILIEISEQGVMPRTEDFIIFPNGETWKVITPMPIEPASERLLFKGIIRKG